MDANPETKTPAQAPGQADGGPIARVAQVFAAQQRNRWRMAATTARDRVRKLERLRDEIVRRRADVEAALRADFGKHPVETEMTEIQPTLAELGHTIRHLPRWMKPKRVPTPILLAGARSEIRYEPLGQVLILAPWNYPFYLTVPPLIAAVAAGNCVVLKPSEKVPRTAEAIAGILDAVFPPEEVAVFLGDHAVADALLAAPFDHVFFTGSIPIGKKVMAAAASHLASVTLELGGKSPAIVDASARVDYAAERIAWGKFVNAGQTCVAPDHVLVHASVADRLVDALVRAIQRYYGRDEAARRASPDFPRMVNVAAAERVEAWMRDALGRGARAAIGGTADPAARYVAPTVLVDVPPDARLLQEEIFGPVLPVTTYGTLDDAIASVRARPKPLALYVFAEDAASADRVLASTTAGGCAVNDVVLQLVNYDLPFGGVGSSGQGSYHGWYGFRELSHEKGVVRQSRLGVAAMLHPPYGARARRLVALAGRFMR
jgi:aldehyde dehydrogenase (NAD+)